MECKYEYEPTILVSLAGFNRYIVECKSKTVTAYDELETDLIDT